MNKKILKIVLVIIIAIIVIATLTLPRFNKLKNMNDNFSNNKSAVENPLQTIDLTVGSGDAVKNGDSVKVNYIGTLADGSEFDNSYKRGAPLEFLVGGGQLIKGFDAGVIGMKKGGKRKIIIPPLLGYGPEGNPPVIPANATITFEVELVEITK